MHVVMPSGATAELRDKLTGKDKFAVQAAIRMSLDTTTGLQDLKGSITNDMRNALLGRLVESWSLSLPLPGVAEDALGEMDLDDYNALADAVEPLLQKVVGNPNSRNAPPGN